LTTLRPGWLNLFVLLGLWNSIRFAALIPVSLVRLLRVRHQEKVLRRASQRTFAAGLGDDTPAQAPAASAAGPR
jgi:hypothetical protein